MKVLVVLLALAVCGLAKPTSENGKIADKTFLEHQKNILRLLMHVHQPNSFQDQVEIAKTWDIEKNMDSYSNSKHVQDFVRQYKTSFLPRGVPFSIVEEVHQDQAVKLFRILYDAKDFETFYKTSVWARDNVNEGMFVYVLTTAILHRPDTQGIVLPAPYEIYPNFFFGSDVIHKAYQYKMQDFVNVKKAQNVVIIPANYTGWYINVEDEQKLGYFTEDIGLNSYYYYYNLDYPQWMNGNVHGISKDRRGEVYHFIHQQILARYYLERLSNGLGKVRSLNINKPVDMSYVPSMHYPNGLDFPFRPANTELTFDDHTKQLLQDIYLTVTRVRNAIDSGYIYREKGEKIDLSKESVVSAMNVIGNMIQGNTDSPHSSLYGALPVYLRKFYGFTGKPLHPYKMQPSALEHYETSLRDPVFYSIVKEIMTLFNHYKKRVPKYTKTDVEYPSVRIENVDVDKLVTFFEHFDIDLNNALYVDYTKDIETTDNVIVRARQMRLNHKPFTYRINLVTDKPGKSLVHVYLGPKYNEYGNEIPLEENRENFVLLDKFVTEIKSGKNVIERNSRNYRHTAVDRTSYFTLYKKVMSAVQGKEDFVLDMSEGHCYYPNRLLLPKGTKGGLVYQMYFIITPYKGSQTVNYDETVSCGIGSGTRYLDENIPFGYPFDRPIDEAVFRTPNMYFKDVAIYHKREEEINSSVQY